LELVALDILYSVPFFGNSFLLYCFVNPGVGCEVVLAKPLQMCVTEDVSMDGALLVCFFVSLQLHGNGLCELMLQAGAQG
jgi:hypothetical protein